MIVVLILKVHLTVDNTATCLLSGLAGAQNPVQEGRRRTRASSHTEDTEGRWESDPCPAVRRIQTFHSFSKPLQQMKADIKGRSRRRSFTAFQTTPPAFGLG